MPEWNARFPIRTNRGMTVKEYIVACVNGILRKRVSAGVRPRTNQTPKNPTAIIQIPMFMPMKSSTKSIPTPISAIVRLLKISPPFLKTPDNERSAKERLII